MPALPITVVSGLPRSGTSMMMRMLEAAGLPILSDGVRSADEDNPRGYFEFERVKKLETDKEWLPQAEGKVVKVVSALLKHLPPTFHYKTIFVEREIGEVLASQRQMLIRRGRPADGVSDEQLGETFRRHLERVRGWLSQQPNFEVLYVSHREILRDPRPVGEAIARFLAVPLDRAQMIAAVDANLYRQRR